MPTIAIKKITGYLEVITEGIMTTNQRIIYVPVVVDGALMRTTKYPIKTAAGDTLEALINVSALTGEIWIYGKNGSSQECAISIKQHKNMGDLTKSIKRAMIKLGANIKEGPRATVHVKDTATPAISNKTVASTVITLSSILEDL
jgi:hypothetical protein